jgi:ferric-dicitrate binding protein FerR (iron transport regulator)
VESNQVKNLVGKYLRGQCTTEEREKLLNWWDEVVAKGEISHFLTAEEQAKIQDMMWTGISAKIKAREREQMRQVRMIPNYKVVLSGVAASILILIAVLYYNPFSKEVTISTDFAEMREVVLPDNSIVLLHGNSSIRYARHWEENDKRSIRLDGEAFFNVTHTLKNTPFVVHTPGQLTITVLGTKFNVNNRSRLTEVALEEGRVQLADGNATYVMKPKEMVTYSTSNATFDSNLTKVQEKISWKDHVLIFEDEPLGAIAEKLKERYGVAIVFQNESWKNDPFTGSIPTDSVLVFLDKIKKLYNGEVVYENGIYLVR